uniref:hypothetical protein n=1 Tax=Marinobacterium profundum TaxID=1714300 RepID=UPI00082F5013|nr:hypothetical protein [Marinobacterium profundum]
MPGALKAECIRTADSNLLTSHSGLTPCRLRLGALHEGFVANWIATDTNTLPLEAFHARRFEI